MGGRPARPAGRLGPSSRPDRPKSRLKRIDFPPKRPNSCSGPPHCLFATEQPPLLAEHSRLRSCVRSSTLLWWDHRTLVCSQQHTPLVAAQYLPLLVLEKEERLPAGLWDSSTELCINCFFWSTELCIKGSMYREAPLSERDSNTAVTIQGIGRIWWDNSSPLPACGGPPTHPNKVVSV